MTGKKLGVAATAILAILAAFSLVGISYFLFPSKQPTPTPKPDPLLDQILYAISWLGLAAFIAILAVATLILANRISHKKHTQIQAVLVSVVCFWSKQLWVL